MRYYRGIRFDNKINYQPTTREMTELAKGWNEVEANIKGFIRARNDNDKLQYLSVIDEDLD